MLGPLPKVYRVIVFVSALLLFVGLGVWVTYVVPGSFLAHIGAGVGAGFGAVAALLLLHDFEHRDDGRSPRPH